MQLLTILNQQLGGYFSSIFSTRIGIIYISIFFSTYMYTTKVDISFRTMKIKRISIASNETQNVRKDTIQISTDLHSERQQKLVFQYTSARLHYSQISNQIILVLIKSFEKSMETFWRMVNADAKAPSSRFIRRRKLTIDTSVR